MKAIETSYKGYRFRSRLEARWAVFFDALNLQWEYEPEGFDLGNGLYYLPDFRVTYPGRCIDERHVVWFEVKPDIASITDEEWRKIEAFSERTELMLLDGPPAQRMYLAVNEIKRDDRDVSELKKAFAMGCTMRQAVEAERSGWALWSSKGRLWWDDYHTFFIYSDMGREVVAAANAARAERFGVHA